MPDTSHWNSMCKVCPGCPLCQLPAEGWKKLDPLAPLVESGPGHTLMRQGQYPKGVHIICRGRLKQWRSNEKGGRFLWRYIGPGEVLGVITLLDGGPYPTTVETTESWLIRFIPTEPFFRLLNEYPVVMLHLLRQVGAKAYYSLRLAMELASSGSALERLARLLYRLWEEKQKSVGDEKPVWIYMSREEMAESIGVKTPETISRLLRKLVERGAIKRDRGVTIIINPELLKTIA